ncbi:hypothetical protein BGZ63DRAFT_494859 [Mariannaea sp. PMI_226]|nr:hypothetical protein BGZ63DRAFT_494859 [Mariannaea sp. PMI_226]
MTLETSSERNTPPLKRQKGRLQACDPCRARKVACDHTLPVCGRCSSRNQHAECKYTDGGPRLERIAIHVQQASPKAATTSGSDQGLQITSSPPTNTNVSSQRCASAVPSNQRISAAKDPGAGYLGSLSHSTVYDEARNRLSTFRNTPAQIDNESGAVADLATSDLLTSSMRDLWLTVLRSLPCPSDCTIKLLSTPYHSGGWVRVAAHRIIKSLEAEFGSHLGFSRTDTQLQKVAQKLSENTLKPLSEKNPDANSWIAEFSSNNLRWESIGLLFIFRKNGVLQRCEDESYEEISLDMSRTCLGYCIELSRSFSTGSSLLLFLLSRKTMMESGIMGYASLAAWRPHADTVALLMFLGIHADSQDVLSPPNFCLENRKRLAAVILSIDQTFVMFTGRPPLIHYKFLSTPLPLDIDDNDFLSGEATALRAFNHLDASGWNTINGIYAVSFIRARAICAFVRAELVEIALDKKPNTSTKILLDIQARQIEAMTHLPPSLLYHPHEVIDVNLPAYHILSKLLIQLDHLQNIFISERLLQRQNVLDEGRLLVTSFEMVSLTLTFWSQKDRLVEARNDFEWLLIAYAAPGGGIMCMELLEPTFIGTHPKNEKITRASIIQQLSLLVAFLDWVYPPAPNADLCANCKAVIQQVLNHVLNSAIESIWPPVSLNAVPLDFNFELLDTFEWARA